MSKWALGVANDWGLRHIGSYDEKRDGGSLIDWEGREPVLVELRAQNKLPDTLGERTRWTAHVVACHYSKCFPKTVHQKS